MKTDPAITPGNGAASYEDPAGLASKLDQSRATIETLRARLANCEADLAALRARLEWAEQKPSHRLNDALGRLATRVWAKARLSLPVRALRKLLRLVLGRGR